MAMRPARLLLILTLALAALVATGAASGRSGGAFQVIVHPSNPVREVDRQFLRDAFLKRAQRWPHDATVRPVDLTRDKAARQAFSREVLGKSIPEVKSYWYQQIFSGKAVPPPEVDSDAAAIAHVLRHPGGVGYLSPDASPGTAKVVTVK